MRSKSCGGEIFQINRVTSPLFQNMLTSNNGMAEPSTPRISPKLRLQPEWQNWPSAKKLKNLPPQNRRSTDIKLGKAIRVTHRTLTKIKAQVNVEIVKRSDHAKGFVVLPKRWVVERTFAWFGRCRRLAKDWECLNRKALAFLRLASIRLMLRKLCNPA